MTTARRHRRQQQKKHADASSKDAFASMFSHDAPPEDAPPQCPQTPVQHQVDDAFAASFPADAPPDDASPPIPPHLPPVHNQQEQAIPPSLDQPARHRQQPHGRRAP